MRFVVAETFILLLLAIFVGVSENGLAKKAGVQNKHKKMEFLNNIFGPRIKIRHL
jgi:hypothetical protein